jgi:hypothetical protein
VEVAFELGLLGRESRRALGFFAERPFEGGAAGIEVRDLRLEGGKSRFRLAKVGFSGLQPVAAVRLRLVDASLGRGQLGRFPFQALNGRLSVRALRRLTGNVLL